MYDPLSSSSSIFSGQDAQEVLAPPWPTTPHPPGSPIPNLRRAISPSPSATGSATSGHPPNTPDKGPAQGLYGKEPQIYGQPEAGLISPRDTVGANGQRFEKNEPYLRVRINGLDRNRRDILVKLDAQVGFFFVGCIIPLESLDCWLVFFDIVGRAETHVVFIFLS